MPNTALDLGPQERFDAVVGELRFQFANPTNWIMKHASERRADTGFGTGPFEQDAIEDFDLIEAVALRFEKLSALVDGCLDNGVVIGGKRYVWPIGFE